MVRPTLAIIKQNDQVRWEGPVLFNGSIAKIDLRTINGFEKHIMLKIEFYKESTARKWIDDVKYKGRFFLYCTSTRTLKISGLKYHILKQTFLS